MALRILIICHDFPPLNSSASRRPYSWARAWADLGHEVHVLTTAKYAHDHLTDSDQDMRGFSVHAVPYLPGMAPAAWVDTAAPVGGAAPRSSWLYTRVKNLTRRLRLGLGLFTEKTTLAYFPMLRAGSRLLAGQPFDLIFSTSGPDMCPMVGAALAARFGVKWISDYRDLWFDEFAVNRYALTTWVVNHLQTWLIRRADLVSTVSDGLAAYLERIAPGRVTVCYNGYLEGGATRPPPVMALAPSQSATLLRVVYTGTFYPLKRDPEVFFDGIVTLLETYPENGARLCVEFYGPAEAWVREQVARRGLGQIVHFRGNVSYQQSIEAQYGADVLLFIDWMDPRAEGVLTGKLFEYLATGRPILCVGNRATTEAVRLIELCAAGEVAITAGQVQASVATALRGEMRVNPDLGRIASYSRRAQAQALLLRAQDDMQPRV